MMNLKSFYRAHLTNYIEIRQSLNYSYKTQIKLIKQLDHLAFIRNETNEGLSESLFQEWSNRRSRESNLSYNARLVVFRDLARYLNAKGISSYEPLIPNFKKQHYSPFIYSASEILRLFQAADEMTTKRCSSSSLVIMPLLLRTLYSTGARIGEALLLESKDIDLFNGTITLRKTKNGKERIVPIDDTLKVCIAEYLSWKKKLPPMADSQLLFSTPTGSNCCYSSVLKWFKKCLENANIKTTKTRHPRLHDLRHTFAIRALNNMYEVEKDVNTLLPVLANYLGHEDYRDTLYYLKQFALESPKFITELNVASAEIIPDLESR